MYACTLRVNEHSLSQFEVTDLFCNVVDLKHKVTKIIQARYRFLIKFYICDWIYENRPNHHKN